MHVGTFLSSAGEQSWGLIEADRVLPGPPLLTAAGLPSAPTLRAFLAGGGTGEQLNQARRHTSHAGFPLNAIRLLAPLPDPSKIVCMGLNFEDYRQILGLEYLAVPQLFLKAPSAIVGPDQPVEIPDGYGTVFHEFEIAAVIGRRLRQPRPDEIGRAIFGYTILNDLVLHDIELMTREYQQWAKNCDTFAPMGPWITTAESMPIRDARMVRRRNGNVEAQSSSASMRHSFPDLIAFVASFMTLEPGDLVTSASPPAGPFQSGDVIEVEVEGIGVLRNRVVGRDVDMRYADRLGLGMSPRLTEHSG
ncbi:MAG TPA: fumarylacetoacetate hydrolase family protein [bacterium]|nr:fumarylacetoacetate hydrolase family protein [bacterium]